MSFPSHWNITISIRGRFRPRTPSKFEKLVGELIAAKKSDEQILEAVTLPAAGQLPTTEEKKTTLEVIGTLTDKKAAWIAIAKALALAPGK